MSEIEFSNNYDNNYIYIVSRSVYISREDYDRMDVHEFIDFCTGRIQYIETYKNIPIRRQSQQAEEMHTLVSRKSIKRTKNNIVTKISTLITRYL